MALIKCEECGHMISDKATECPNCGCPIEKEIEKKIVCEECGAEITPDMDECPNCGCPIHANEVIEETVAKEMDEGKSHRKRNMIIAVAILVVVVGCGLWFCLGKGKEGKVKITPEFCEAIKEYYRLYEFHNGLAAVEKIHEETCGFINTKGELVIPCTLKMPYDYWRAGYPFYYSDGLIGVSDGEREGRYGFINKKGKQVVPMIYSGISNFSEGLAAVQDPTSEKWGFINTKGKVVVPCQYSYAEDFSEGLAAVLDLTSEKWGFIDKKGRVVIPCQYTEVGIFSEGIVAVIKDEGDKIDFMDKSGKLVSKLSGKFGKVIKNYSSYSYPEPLLSVKFEKGVCEVSNSSNQNIRIGKNGVETNDTICKKYTKFEEEGKSVGSIYGSEWYEPDKYGYNDRNGNVVVPAKYSYISEFSNGVAVAELCSNFSCEANKIIFFGYVDEHGNDTFSQENWNEIAKANEEVEQKRIEYERQLRHDGPGWLQGAWKVILSTGDITYAMFDHGILRSKIYFRGEGVVRLPDNQYTYENGKLQWVNATPRLDIDSNKECVLSADGQTMTKTTETEFLQCGNDRYYNGGTNDRVAKAANDVYNKANEINNKLSELMRLEYSNRVTFQDIARMQQLRHEIIMGYDELMRIGRAYNNNEVYNKAYQGKLSALQLFKTLKY